MKKKKHGFSEYNKIKWNKMKKRKKKHNKKQRRRQKCKKEQTHVQIEDKQKAKWSQLLK